MKKIILIALAGALGVVLRHLLEVRFGNKGELIPAGTLIANLGGCFVAGLLFQAAMARPAFQEHSSILLVGFCGGLTTFSGYALVSLGNLANDHFAKAGAYLLLSPALGMLFVFLGIRAAKIAFN